MGKLQAVLVLVAVLTALAGASEPTIVKIVFGSRQRRAGSIRALKHGNGHGAGMHTSVAFGWWDSLNSMSTGFIRKVRYISRCGQDNDGV